MLNPMKNIPYKNNFDLVYFSIPLVFLLPLVSLSLSIWEFFFLTFPLADKEKLPDIISYKPLHGNGVADAAAAFCVVTCLLAMLCCCAGKILLFNLLQFVII